MTPEILQASHLRQSHIYIKFRIIGGCSFTLLISKKLDKMHKIGLEIR